MYYMYTFEIRCAILWIEYHIGSVSSWRHLVESIVFIWLEENLFVGNQDSIIPVKDKAKKKKKVTSNMVSIWSTFGLLILNIFLFLNHMVFYAFTLRRNMISTLMRNSKQQQA